MLGDGASDGLRPEPKERVLKGGAGQGATFVVPHTWPDVRNAEYEVLQRMAIAASNIGSTMIAVNNDGYPLWASQKLSLDKSERITPSEVDFMISLHFESPKLFDVYSYYALWQPLQFYHQFGYAASIEKVLTHNDCLSCDSTMADAHAMNVFGAARPGLLTPLPQLFHSPPKPYLSPKISEASRLFYIGINWERINGTKGRHHNLLLGLDEADLIDIYGPKLFLGAKPWDGFKTYRGELPFDGRAVVRAQNESGICLALSSEAHMATGLMSNRLFEGLAGGAAIVADRNTFVEKHFSDLVYFVNNRGSEDDLNFQIKSILDDIRSDPKAATERALEGQRRLAEKFSLEGCLEALIAAHKTRHAAYQGATLATASATVVIVYPGDSVSEALRLLDTAKAQANVTLDIALVCDTAFLETHRKRLEAAIAGQVAQLTIYPADISRQEGAGGEYPRPMPTGPLVAKALSAIRTDYFCFLSNAEEWFQDHLSSVIGAIERTPGARIGVSGGLIENDVNAKPPSRRVSSVRFAFDDVDLLSGRYSTEFGRFVYSRGVLDDAPLDCLYVLDGQEGNLVRLAAALQGPLAQSALATYVVHESAASKQPEAVIPLFEQQQYIRDAFAFDQRWQKRLEAQTAAVANIERQLQPPAPVRWDNFIRPRGSAMRLPTNTMVDTSRDGSGMKYMGEGFSYPESTYTWIDGKLGVLEFSCYRDAMAELADYDIALQMMGRRSADGRPQHCTFVLNGLSVAYLQISEAPTPVTIRLPPAVRDMSQRIRLEIVPDHAELVRDAKGKVIDNRALGAAVFSFGLMGNGDLKPMVVSPAKVYGTAKRGEGLPALLDGFSYPEPDGVWMTGERARMQFQIQDFRAPMSIRLRLVGRTDRKASKPQMISVEVNERKSVKFVAPEEVSDHIIPLADDMVGVDGACRVTLSFSHAQPVTDSEGVVLDGRLLAANLKSFEIVSGHPARGGPGGLPSSTPVVPSITGRAMRKAASVLRR